MRSLKSRLTINLVVALVAVFGLQWLLVGLSIKRITENYIVSHLARDADTLLAGLTPGADGAFTLSAKHAGSMYEQPLSGHYFQIRAGGEVMRSRSLWDEQLDIPDAATGRQQRLKITGPRDQSLLVLVMGFALHEKPVTVAIAEDMTAVNADIARFRRDYLLVSAAALALLILLQYFGITRALRPLESIRLDIKKLSQGRIEAMPREVPAEIRPLSEEINHLLDILARRLKQSRTAIGNLAHGLKTPLTLLTRLADDASSRTPAQVRERLLSESGTMRRLIDRELKRARLAGAGPAGARFIAEQDLPELIDVLKRIYAEKSLTIDLSLPERGGTWPDREDMMELLGNLGDNACKWARSRVCVGIDCDRELSVTVEDDGPGCPPERLAELAQRGKRADESREGHGLGLAIVQDIISHYGGSLLLDASPRLRGLRVTVRLPLEP